MDISDLSRRYLSSVPQQPKITFAELFPESEPIALDLLSKMLTINPNDRISATEALEHPYFESLHEPCDEPLCTCPPIETSFENMDTVDLRREIFQEILNYNPQLAC